MVTYMSVILLKDFLDGNEKDIQLNKYPEKIFFSPLLELILRWILGITFIYASFHKITSPAKFAEVIYSYYLFPTYTINLIAIIFPFLELFLGLALMLGIYPRTAALIMNILLLTFIVVISINLIKGLKFECGCFSFGHTETNYSVVLLLSRNIIYFIFGLQVLLYPKVRKLCILQNGSILRDLGIVQSV